MHKGTFCYSDTFHVYRVTSGTLYSNSVSQSTPQSPARRSLRILLGVEALVIIPIILAGPEPVDYLLMLSIETKSTLALDLTVLRDDFEFQKSIAFSASIRFFLTETHRSKGTLSQQA